MGFPFLRTILKSLFRLGRGRNPQCPVSPSPQDQVRLNLQQDEWCGTATLADLPESLGSLIQSTAPDHQERLQCLVQRLACLTGHELVDLDIEARRWRHSEYGQTAWARLQPRDIKKVERISPSGNPHLLGLVSFHPNGHAREAALQALERQQSPGMFPYLLLRLNDWADPITELSLKLLAQVAPLQSGEAILQHIDLVLRLQRATRRGHSHWVDHFLGLLAKPENQGALLKSLQSPTLPVKRLCFDLAMNTGALPDNVVLDRSLSESDPIIRLKVQGTLLERAHGAAVDKLIAVALEDPAPCCRRAGLEWLEKAQLPDRAVLSRGALLDRSRTVRETARWIQKQCGCDEAREMYLASLSSGDMARRIAAIQGLGEVGTKTDAAAVVPHASSPVPRERQAALTALGRLDAESHRKVFLDALVSDHARTSRVACEVLLKGSTWPTQQWLLDQYRATDHLHVRRGVLALTQKLPKWQAMTFLLDVMPQRPEDIDPVLSFHLTRWLRSLLRVPPPQGGELERTRMSLCEARERLGWRVFPEVDGLLD